MNSELTRRRYQYRLLLHAGGMAHRSVMQMAVLIAMFAMVTSWVPMSAPSNELPANNESREQLEGPTLEERCSSITFEDMFDYSSAIFEVEIASDWESADVHAIAWVNGTFADIVRTNLDTFVAEVYPSGDDGWISTDEREGVRAIASECVEHTLTRIGMRDGGPHRGGVGTDWKNISWTEDEVLVEEWNLVPEDHSQVRSCSGWGSSSDCVEIPVVPNSDRDCDTNIAATAEIDECRLMLWLNASLTINNINSPDEFTIAFNASNLSNIVYNFHFPHTEELRLDMWEECEGRNVEVEIDEYAGEAPLRGTCLGDASSSYQLIENDDGSLTYSIEPNMPIWPIGEDLFADFTTAPIPIDNPPAWTESAPEDDAWFPKSSGGQQVIANWQEMQNWFSDEAALSSLTINCRGDAGLNIQIENRDLSMDVPRGEAGEVTCEAIDQAGQSSGNRSWNVGVPFQISTTNTELSDPHPITMSPTSGWPELSVLVGLTSEFGVSQGSSGPFSLFVSEITVDVDASGTVPGPAYVWVEVTGDGVYSMEEFYDLGIIKTGAPPSIVVNSEGWDGNSWSMNGVFSDPDGESVSFNLLIDGGVTGEVTVNGNSWSTPMIDFSVWSEGTHTVVVRGCDESELCNEVQRVIDNTHLFAEPEPIIEEPDTTDSGFSLPAMGLPGLILAASAALIYSGRRGSSHEL